MPQNSRQKTFRPWKQNARSDSRWQTSASNNETLLHKRHAWQIPHWGTWHSHCAWVKCWGGCFGEVGGSAAHPPSVTITTLMEENTQVIAMWRHAVYWVPPKPPGQWNAAGEGGGAVGSYVCQRLLAPYEQQAICHRPPNTGLNDRAPAPVPVSPRPC